jgi:molybdopterin-guanine dinucleotide biosynthesis protein A
LSAALVAQDAELAVAVTGEGDALQPHPVFCLMKASVLPHLSAFLRDGGRKIDAWYGSLKFIEVHFSDDTAFRNINTLEELQRFEPS